MAKPLGGNTKELAAMLALFLLAIEKCRTKQYHLIIICNSLSHIASIFSRNGLQEILSVCPRGMIKIHNAGAAAFAKEAISGSNPGLRSFAVQTYRVVHRHLAELQAKVKHFRS